MNQIHRINKFRNRNLKKTSGFNRRLLIFYSDIIFLIGTNENLRLKPEAIDIDFCI